MLAVLVYTVLIVIGFGTGLGKFSKHGWQNYMDDMGDNPAGTAIFGTVCVTLLAIWLVLSLGWFWATGLYVVCAVVSIASQWYRVAATGGIYKVTLVGFWVGIALSIVLLTGLWQAVLQ